MEHNQDNLYKTAELLYELQRERGGAAPNPESIRNKFFQLIRGLPVEDEFAALCLWSGKCSLIHKLDKDVRPEETDYRVPDFLCIFEYEGRHVPVLVEVKSSRRERYPFTRNYCVKLKRYADTLKMPLLIAFKHTRFERPFWSLFDFEQMRTPRGSYRVDMPDFIKHDLMGVLLGNFHVQMWEGTAISMTITKEEIHSEKEFVGKLTDIHWETRDKRRVDFDNLLHWLFMLTEDQVEIEESADKLVQCFRKVSDESAVAYWVLAHALPTERYQVAGFTDWGRMIDEHQFSFSLEDLRNAAVSAIDSGLVRYVLDMRPHEMPAFLVPKEEKT